MSNKDIASELKQLYSTCKELESLQRKYQKFFQNLTVPPQDTTTTDIYNYSLTAAEVTKLRAILADCEPTAEQCLHQVQQCLNHVSGLETIKRRHGIEDPDTPQNKKARQQQMAQKGPFLPTDIVRLSPMFDMTARHLSIINT